MNPGRTASFLEKDPYRYSFQSPFWVLGHYIRVILRNKMFLGGNIIIFIAFITYFYIKRYDQMRITLVRIKIKQKLHYMLSIY